MAKRWLSHSPDNCDLCQREITSTFIDGWTAFGWACMCESCHQSHGKGLGIGKGQLYKQEEDGIFYLKKGGS
jgi:hypothetical protein